jgi:hypothetical protein
MRQDLTATVYLGREGPDGEFDITVEVSGEVSEDERGFELECEIVSSSHVLTADEEKYALDQAPDAIDQAVNDAQDKYDDSQWDSRNEE